MARDRLHPKAWVAFALQGLYSGADALCFIFVSVYFWRNSQDFMLICRHYLILYTVTPVFFLLAGWYAQARDRLHCYRLGLALHACYYGTLLLLRERSPEYAGWLGAFLGVTWGVFWAGANTFDFDVTVHGRREYYFGVLHTVGGLVRFLAPLIGGKIITASSDGLTGYHRVFALAIALYVVAFAISYQMPRDSERRPFRIRRALFPGKDQRDWRLVMLASASLAGTFNILAFLLGLLMFMKTGSELSVGSLASLEAGTGIMVAYLTGRVVVPENRRTFMRWGVILLVFAGAVISLRITVASLFAFGLLRAVSSPMFSVPHFSLRLDIIARDAEDPSQRIEYISAWEVPLALGRIAMMLLIMALYTWLSHSELGLRVALFALCAVRIVTYQLLIRTSPVREFSQPTPRPDSG